MDPDKATEALGHVQAAVLEMLAAARVALDLIEGVVTEPAMLAPLVALLTDLGRAATTGAARTAEAARTAGAAAESAASSGESRANGREGDGDDKRVRRIKVS
jgi:hypothetical protein